MSADKLTLHLVTVVLSIAALVPVPARGGEQEEQTTDDRIKAWVSSWGGDQADPRQRLPFMDQVRVIRRFTPEDVGVIVKRMDEPEGTERRHHGYGIAWDIIEYSENKNVRQAILLALLQRKINEPFSKGIEELSTMCVSEDFSAECKRLLFDGALALEQSGKITGPIIRLIGLAEIREALPMLDSIEARIQSEMGYDPLSRASADTKMTLRSERAIVWNCLLVRARWGDKAAMGRAIQVIDSLPDERDRVMQSASLVMRTARREAIEYTMQFLYSDAKLNPDAEFSMSYGTHVVGSLSTFIPDLPVGKGLDASRKWMKEHEKDYRITVRTSRMASAQRREEYEKREKAAKEQCDKKDGTP